MGFMMIKKINCVNCIFLAKFNLFNGKSETIVLTLKFVKRAFQLPISFWLLCCKQTWIAYRKNKSVNSIKEQVEKQEISQLKMHLRLAMILRVLHIAINACFKLR